MHLDSIESNGELGLDVLPVDAGLLREAYSESMNSSWLSGAETVKVRESFLSVC